VNVRAGRTWLSSGLLAALLVACSSDERRSPAEQCVDYQNAYCDKAVACAVPSDKADFAETCDFTWQVYSYCDRVVVVTESYPLCMQAIRSIDCNSVSQGSFPEFPHDCSSIFQVDR
jgi:hypothetical protein